MEMPTAMLGDGAHLVNAGGERFMFRYNPGQGEKGIEKARMALCIQQEIDEGRGLPDGTVIFDTTQLAPERLESYVAHCKRLRTAGLEPSKQTPRVRPAAHSQMGGIRVDATTWTGVPGLFAAGEAAGGVHGASRLAGNGASDVIVFGGIAGKAAARAAWQGNAARNWQAIHVRTPPEAFCMMATSVATGLEIEGEDHIRPVAWEDWIKLPIRDQDEAVHTVRGQIRVPTRYSGSEMIVRKLTEMTPSITS
jgi:succinate dehydrogenase/fumarate reductase flavoprotein subunit